MSAEVKKEIQLEIAHVLFLDIVGYSKLSVNEQHGRVDELNGIVRLSEQFQKAEASNRILKIPTVPARHRHLRSETWGAHKCYQPLLGRGWECASADKAAGNSSGH